MTDAENSRLMEELSETKKEVTDMETRALEAERDRDALRQALRDVQREASPLMHAQRSVEIQHVKPIGRKFHRIALMALEPGMFHASGAES